MHNMKFQFETKFHTITIIIKDRMKLKNNYYNNYYFYTYNLWTICAKLNSKT